MAGLKKWLNVFAPFGTCWSSETVYTVSDHPEKLEKLEGVEITHIFNPEKTLGLAGQFIYDLRCI